MSENWIIMNWSISSDLNNYKTISHRNMNLVSLFSIYSQLTAKTLSLHQHGGALHKKMEIGALIGFYSVYLMTHM